MHHFDPTLGNVLNLRMVDGVVEHNVFHSWRDHIGVCLRERLWKAHAERYAQENGGLVSQEGIKEYKAQPFCELYDAAREHAAKFERSLNANHILVLTHPLYLGLSHFDKLKTAEQKSDANEYLDRLCKVLERELPPEKLGIVLLETLHHYAGCTAELLERGSVDRVVFTRFDAGTVLELTALEGLRGKSLYVAGGYNAKCLKEGFESLRKAMGGDDSIYATGDMVLESPLDYHFRLLSSRLTSFHTYQGDLPFEKVLSLADVFARASEESLPSSNL